MKGRLKRAIRFLFFFVLFIICILFLFILHEKKYSGLELTDEPNVLANISPQRNNNIDTVKVTATEKSYYAKNKNIGNKKDKSLLPTEENSLTDDETIPRLHDVMPPVIAIAPAPGVYRDKIKVKMQINEDGIIQYKSIYDTEWLTYENEIPVDDSLEIIIRAFDIAGNKANTVHRSWFVKKEPFACPDNMEPVLYNNLRFCIDKYEWPNKRGVIPASYINKYEADDSCRAIGKRLCDATEWEVACGGSASYNYPYGNEYETRTCNTENDKVTASGIMDECRSGYGVYDMSGNLREWTTTKSEKNSSHYKVYGGYWANSSSSKCNMTQYSFFPENRFIHIGFRCCMDAPPAR